MFARTNSVSQKVLCLIRYVTAMYYLRMYKIFRLEKHRVKFLKRWDKWVQT